jgi:AraC family transcriptional regulator
MKIEVVERQPVIVAALRYTGPFGEPLNRFWRHTVAPQLADHGLLDCPRYGVALDNPMNTPLDKCRHDACIELSPGLSLPGSVQTTIAGGRYAITHFKGTGAAIGAAWSEFIGATLADAANRPDWRRPMFEHYPRGSIRERPSDAPPHRQVRRRPRSSERMEIAHRAAVGRSART